MLGGRSRKRAHALRSRKQREHQARRKKLMIALAVFLVGSVLAGAVFLLRSEGLQVRSVRVVGEVREEELLEEDARAYLAGSYAFLIPRSSSPLIPTRSIEKHLLSGNVELEEVKVGVEDDTLVVEVSEREPRALWCEYDGSEPTAPCLFVDYDTFAYAPAPFFSQAPFFVYAREDRSPEISSVLFRDEKRRSAILNLVESLEAYSLNPEFVVITKDESVEVQLGVSGLPVSDARLIFDATEDLEKASARINKLVEDEVFEEVLRDEGGSAFSYIDVRFGNKIFYRVRGREDIEHESPEPASSEEDITLDSHESSVVSSDLQEAQREE